MFNKKISTMQDERAVSLNRKITSEAYQLMMICLIASILYQQFIVNADIKEYATEFICFFGSSFYIIARKMYLGFNPYEKIVKSKNIMFKQIASISITIGIVSLYLDYRSGSALTVNSFILSIVAAACSAFVFLLLLYFVGKRRQDNIDKKLNEDENNIE